MVEKDFGDLESRSTCCARCPPPRLPPTAAANGTTVDESRASIMPSSVAAVAKSSAGNTTVRKEDKKMAVETVPLTAAAAESKATNKAHHSVRTKTMAAQVQNWMPRGAIHRQEAAHHHHIIHRRRCLIEESIRRPGGIRVFIFCGGLLPYVYCFVCVASNHRSAQRHRGTERNELL